MFFPDLTGRLRHCRSERNRERERGDSGGGLKMSVENESQRLTQGRGRERRETHLDKKGEQERKKESFHRHISNFPFSIDMCLLCLIIISLVAFTDFVQQNVCQGLLFSSSRLCN